MIEILNNSDLKENRTVNAIMTNIVLAAVSLFFNGFGVYLTIQGYRIYSFEADTIAQNIRSNSKVETIERVIKEVFSDIEINDEFIKQIASLIKGIK